MSTKTKLILAAVIGVIAFIVLDGPEYACKTVNPVGYWTEKRDKSQEIVAFCQNEMRSCILEFEKLKRTRDITIGQSILAGSTPQEALDEFIAHWDATIKACSIMKDLLAMEQTNLENANRELARHK